MFGVEDGLAEKKRVPSGINKNVSFHRVYGNEKTPHEIRSVNKKAERGLRAKHLTRLEVGST